MQVNMEIKKLILDEIKSISFVQLGLDDSIIESQLLDSIGLIDLVIFIEENIGVKIPTNDINKENFDTVNKITDYLIKRKNN